MKIDFDMLLDVEYAVVSEMKPGRAYPIDIVSAKHRGLDVLSSLHVEQILTLQRRVYNRLVDAGVIILERTSNTEGG